MTGSQSVNQTMIGWGALEPGNILAGRTAFCLIVSLTLHALAATALWGVYTQASHGKTENPAQVIPIEMATLGDMFGATVHSDPEPLKVPEAQMANLPATAPAMPDFRTRQPKKPAQTSGVEKTSPAKSPLQRKMVANNAPSPKSQTKQARAENAPSSSLSKTHSSRQTPTQAAGGQDAGSNPSPAPKAVSEPATPVLIREPSFLSQPKPPLYPSAARNNNQHGTVIVRARVAEPGTPDLVEVYRSSGYVMLDEAALWAVRQWEFAAHRIDNHIVVSWVEIPVRFELN